MNLLAFSRVMGPFRGRSEAFSIRRRLLGLSLLTVLGGYVLLIGATALLASKERRASHRATVATVARSCAPTGSTPRACMPSATPWPG